MNEHEIHCGLRQPPHDEFPHNNKPKIGVHNGGEYGGEVQQVVGVGEHYTIVFGGYEVILALFPIKLSSCYSTSHHYILCIFGHGANMAQKPTFGCVMLVPSATRFFTMSATCRPTCCQHVGPDISCLSFRTSGW